MNLLCLECGSEVHLEPDQGVDACPECGDDKAIPANLDKMLNIRISEHELRILTMWADNYARSIKLGQVTRHILDRLSTQTDIPLSLSQELADVRAAGFEVSVFDGNGREVDL